VTTRVLLVDDDASLCETLAIGLGRRSCDVVTCTSAEEAFRRVLEDDFDVVVTDLNMRQVGGIELCERIVANRPDLPVIVLTAFGSLETAVAAIRAGAYDFISKPIEVEVLTIATDRAAAHRRLCEEVKRLRIECAASKFEQLIAEGSAMRGVIELMKRVAPSDVTVLVTGESGTGKEVVARALHDQGRRSHGPFVAINCAAMPETLLESELFGHTRGAFTDAKSNHSGLFVRANGGTIFLDEIGDMPLSVQPKLLRVLQERKVRPLGGNTEIPIDVRVVAATNRDLETAIEEGRFREDLFYRINVVNLRLPALRARGRDILALAQYFVEELARREEKTVKGFTPQTAEKLLAYAWPGNVRELQNCVERAVALARFELIGVDDLPEIVREYRPSHVIVAAEDPSELVPMEEVERRYVRRVLEAVGQNKTAAARILGIDRKRLYRWLERFAAAGKEEAAR
jgi:two-component system response regulator HydG